MSGLAGQGRLGPSGLAAFTAGKDTPAPSQRGTRSRDSGLSVSALRLPARTLRRNLAP